MPQGGNEAFSRVLIDKALEDSRLRLENLFQSMVHRAFEGEL